MLSKRKVIRDAIVIIALIVAAFFLLRSPEPGPVERLQHPSSPHTDRAAGVPMSHSPISPDLSSGEILVSVGNFKIGKNWFDFRFEKARQNLLEKQIVEPELVDDFAKEQVLIEGLVEIIQQKAIEEWGIQPDMDIIAEQEKLFDSSPDAQKMLNDMGLTKEQLVAKWKSDSQKAKCEIYFAEKAGLEPGSDEAEAAFSDWMLMQLRQIEVKFEDSTLEALFSRYLKEISEYQPVQESTIQQ